MYEITVRIKRKKHNFMTDCYDKDIQKIIKDYQNWVLLQCQSMINIPVFCLKNVSWIEN